MSSVKHVALVGEGPTDLVVIEAALRGCVPEVSFVVTQLQPEGSLAFGSLGAGWPGVYKWCKQSKARRGPGDGLVDSLLTLSFDFLIVHVDADVAHANYSEGGIDPEEEDGGLPCDRPCPPASDTVDRLRAVVRSWLGLNQTSTEPIVLCVPTQNTEAWVLGLLFPKDGALKGKLSIECLRNPAARLAAQPKASRLRKSVADYRQREEELSTAWPRLAQSDAFSQAVRFVADLRAVALPSHTA